MISVTTILGTDSLSGSRLVINDNFSILADEINAMEGYFDPSAGTIDGLTSLQTESLKVGLSTVRLDINSSTFDIVADVDMVGDLDIQGSILRNDIEPTSITEISTAPLLIQEIGTSTTVPPRTVYRTHNAGTSAVTIQIHPAVAGQELFFIYEGGGTGEVAIEAAAGASLTLDSGATQISLNEAGHTVHLMSITNSVGNQEYYIVGGNGYGLLT